MDFNVVLPSFFFQRKGHRLNPILIVDDEPDNLDALRRLLRNQYDVTVAQSPFEALKIVQKQGFHVIVSDQRMPEMSGVEFLEKVKTICPDSTRILLTGYTDIDSVIGAINRGNIYRYIAKPWDPDDLKLTLRQANEAYLMREALNLKNAELSESNASLRRALAELEVLDKAKARFLSLVSHELNTPLTVIQSFVGLLAEKKTQLDAEVQTAISSLQKASGRFGEIVAEVLTFVKMESEGRLSLAPHDLKETVSQMGREAQASLAKKQLSLAIEGESMVVAYDLEKMKVALKKLLEDAAIRSPEKTQMRVALTREAQRVRVVVSREGGPWEDQAFEAFQTASPQMHHHQNLGLSLAIFKMIIEEHGGEIEILSGKRHTVTFFLPSAPLPQ